MMGRAFESEFAYALGKPPSTGVMKQSCADFCVEEQLGFEPSGEGEHQFLQIQKSDQHTHRVAARVAEIAGVAWADVGYAGLKDKRALTCQWFSVYLPGRSSPSWQQLEEQGIHIKQVTRHKKKLRRGVHKSNRFEICLREISADRKELEDRLKRVARGAPNYFGEQRFGWQRSNLVKAQKMFAGDLRVKKRDQRSMVLSAARAFLFNQVLSLRVANNTWNTCLAGDTIMLNGSNSVFSGDPFDTTITQRLIEGDLHIAGPMWGKGRFLWGGGRPLGEDERLLREEGANQAESQIESLVADQPGKLEQQVIEQYAQLAKGLEKAGLKYQRRALRLIPQDFSWQWLDERSLTIRFVLPAGCFATTLLREILNLSEINKQE